MFTNLMLIGVLLNTYTIITLCLIVVALVVYWVHHSEYKNANVQSNLQEPIANLPKDQQPANSDSEMSVEEKRYAKSFNRWLICINISVFVLSLTMIDLGKTWSSWETLSKLNWTTAGVTLLLLHMLYTLASLSSINLSQQVILLFFGKFVRDVKPGLVYTPRGFCRLIVAPKAMFARDLPADPTLIDHGDLQEEKRTVKEGFVTPLRVTFLPPPENGVEIAESTPKRIISKDDPYNCRLTAEVEASYGFRIINLRKFYEKIKDLNLAASDMDDVTTAELTNQLSVLTPAEALTKLEEVSTKVADTLTEYVKDKDWGVEVSFTRIKMLGFPHDLNKAVAGIPTARAKKEATILESEGTMQKLTNVGEGTANAIQFALDAKAEGLAKMAEVAKDDNGRFAMLAASAVEAASFRNFAVVNPNDLIGGLLALKGVSDGLEKIQPPPTLPGNVPKEKKEEK